MEKKIQSEWGCWITWYDYVQSNNTISLSSQTNGLEVTIYRRRVLSV